MSKAKIFTVKVPRIIAWTVSSPGKNSVVKSQVERESEYFEQIKIIYHN